MKKENENLINKHHAVVKCWWEKRGEAWAKRNNITSRLAPHQDVLPYEALAHLMGDPCPKDVSSGQRWIVNIDNPRVANLIEAIHNHPNTIIKLLEIQYEEAHRKDNQ